MCDLRSLWPVGVCLPAYTRVRPGMVPMLPRPLETCDERFDALLAERERARAALLGNATEGEPIPVPDRPDLKPKAGRLARFILALPRGAEKKDLALGRTREGSNGGLVSNS